jgi:hypothetical protein
LANEDQKLDSVSRIKRNGRRRELRGAELSAIKESSAPGRRRSADRNAA